MRWTTVIMLLGALALAGCESASESTGTAAGAGGAGAGAGGRAGDSQMAARTEGPRPGSQEDLTINVGDRIFFDLDSHALRNDARGILEKQAAWLQQNRNVTVSIEGHADERGTREYNLALGERRANAVRDYLVALGIDPNRIKTVSYGKERPVDARSTEEAWSRNRRGVMVVN